MSYQHATHYSYDIHGNVKTLVQDFPEMDNPVNGNSKKRIDYRYDLISGNVLQVSYQSGKADQYYHRYEYDADNRITAVYTSDYGWEGGTAEANLLMPEDMMFWERDAVYRYYKHGPLAKVEYGELGVQGVDYAYTLQGWLKGVNSTKLDEVNDMGKDGNMAMNTPYQYFARDAFSYNLSYNKNDYSPIRGAQVGDVNCWLADNSNSFTQSNRFDLWNGNIGAMATTLNTGGANPTNLYQNMAYQYDQLNRLKSAVGQGNFDEQNNNWGANADITNRYKNAFTYDPNGNILTQKRYDQNGVQFDDLIYRYNYNNEGRFIDNRLYHVSDNIAANVNAEDIDNQTTTAVFEPRLRDIHGSALNYAYDELGQLIRDNQESIEQINWRVDGKISDIYRVNASGKKELSFVYDAMGNRVAKNVMTASGAWIETEYYVRDAQGNVMAIYKRSIRNDAMEFELTEQHIYGSARLGVDRRNVDMIAAATPNDNGAWQVKRGEKHYELSNHLGNVLATVSDKKIAVMNGANLSYYRADVVSYSDYYPFGAPMTERTAVVTPTEVRYGFQGQEEDDELWNGAVSFKYRVEDARLGRFFSGDPLSSKFPWNSCYAFSENRVVDCIDFEGAEAFGCTTMNYIKGGVFIGLGYGLAAELRSGNAFDMIGYSQFVMATTLYPGNQDLEKGSKSPKTIMGGEASLNLGAEVNFRETFEESMKLDGIGFSPGASFHWGVGGSGGIKYDGDGNWGGFNLEIGIGFGGVITTGNQSKLINAISVTYSEWLSIKTASIGSITSKNDLWTIGTSNQVELNEKKYNKAQLLVSNGLDSKRETGVYVYQELDLKGKPVTNQWKSEIYMKEEESYEEDK